MPKQNKTKHKQNNDEKMIGGWDDINETLTACRNYVSLASIAKPIIDEFKKIPVEEQDKDVYSSIETVATNIKPLVDELNFIASVIGDRKGDVHFNDFYVYLDLANKLQGWADKYDSIIMPHIGVLTGYLAEKEQALKGDK